MAEDLQLKKSTKEINIIKTFSNVILKEKQGQHPRISRKPVYKGGKQRPCGSLTFT